MAISTEDFPLIAAAIKDKSNACKQFELGLAVINNAIEADGLSKARLKDAKDYLNRVTQSAVNNTLEQFRFWDLSKSEQDLHHMISLNYYLHTSAAALKRIEASKLTTPYAKAAQSIFADINRLHQIVEPLKDKIITKKPKGDPVLAYKPPPASNTAQKAVYDALVEITDNNYKALVDLLRDQKIGVVESFQKAQKEEGASPYSFCHAPNGGPIMSRQEVIFKVFDIRNPRTVEALTPKKNFRSILTKDAEKEADYLRLTFIYKNMSKIAPIVDAKKGLFKSAEVIEQSVRLLEAVVAISFTDGAKFNAETSIVYSWSVLGTPFTRYPLTFHKVVTPDGKVRAMMSEKEMNTKFLGK